MALKRIDKNPSITDTILFDIITTDVNGCSIDPQTIDFVNIYFLERGFDSNAIPQEYTYNIEQSNLLIQYSNLQQLYCEAPTEELQNQLTSLQGQLASTGISEI